MQIFFLNINDPGNKKALGEIFIKPD